MTTADPAAVRLIAVVVDSDHVLLVKNRDGGCWELPAGALQADEVDVRVASQDADELRADVTCRPDDPATDPSRATRRVHAALRAGDEP